LTKGGSRGVNSQRPRGGRNAFVTLSNKTTNAERSTMITHLRPRKYAVLAPHRRLHRRRRSVPSTLFSATIFRLRPRLEVIEDRTLLSTFLVSNTFDSGPGSLRQAILDSNNAVGATNTIDFDIPGFGVQTIFPFSSLPAITNPVLIDGFSQPGYS